MAKKPAAHGEGWHLASAYINVKQAKAANQPIGSSK